MLSNILSANLRRRRKALRISQVDLELKTGVSQAKISDIERDNGKCNPSITTVEKLAGGLKSAPWLMLAEWFDDSHSDQVPDLYKKFNELSIANREKVMGYIDDLLLAERSILNAARNPVETVKNKG
jgi:transcriptional regulator with XRE-family HTH domain